MRLRRYRPIVTLLLLLPIQACSAWQPVPVSPRRVLEDQNPSKVRVTRSDGPRIILDAPLIIRNDSLISTITVRRCFDVPGQSRRHCLLYPETRGVAYADVRILEVRQFETALAVVGFIGFASAIIVGVSLSR